MANGGVVSIGRCKECNRMTRLDEEVCRACLAHPRHDGWAGLARRCRVDRAFARVMYRMLQSEDEREGFRALFGDPTPPR
jgi:hypothetical protein